MTELATRHLTTLTLTIDNPHVLEIGAVAAGRRRIAPVIGGNFKGERLSGEVLPGGADWMVIRPDRTIMLDVRLPLRADDGALIYLSYTGTYVADPEALARLARGEPVEPYQYKLRTVACFETGADQWRWLNDLVVVGTGRREATGPDYDLYEIL